MICALPDCFGRTKVLESRYIPLFNGIRRRRRCTTCGHTWWTVEINQEFVTWPETETTDEN